MPNERGAGGRLTVDLDALATNWRTLETRAAPGETAAVVKADGYGLGIAPVVRSLRAAGCKTFFVALPEEGVTARQHAPDATIYILNGFFAEAAETYRQHRLRPVIGSLDELDDVARRLGEGPGAALHVDTGMNRLGLSMEEALALDPADPRLTRAGVGLLMSHPACADTPDHPLNARQTEAFSAAKAHLPALAASLANSAGTLAGGPFLHDLARPGIALYGGCARSGEPSLRAVVRLEVRVLAVRAVKKGESVGYGAAETLKADGRVAILSAGYADGLLRAAGSADGHAGAAAMIAGTLCPFVGRVSMDLIAIDVSALPEASVTRGTIAEILNETLTVDRYGEAAGTIGYEVLTALGSRYARSYIGDPGDTR